MQQTPSDATLSFLFDEAPAQCDGLCDPFAESEAEEVITAPPSRTVSVSDSDEVDSTTYTFRWDVEVPLAERGKCGMKFMKQWKRVLQAQKLSPLVSSQLSPHEARFQLCVLAGWESKQVEEREAEIIEQLSHLRRDALPVAGEPAGTHPAGWQGVRIWMTFDRHDVETALAKKPKV